MNKLDIIDIIRSAGAETDRMILDALEDGEALARLGITDDDTEAVEDAYLLVAGRL